MTLYTTGCSKCKVLETLLKRKNVEYTPNTDTNEMIMLGFTSAPVLEVNGKYLHFDEAYDYINAIQKGES